MGRKERRTAWGQEVGERLANAIEQRGGKPSRQRDFAARVGMSESGFSLWISGAIPDSWAKLRRVAEQAGVSADELLGLSRPMPAPISPPEKGDWTLVPRVAEQVAAGQPIFDETDVADRDWYCFRSGYVRHLVGKHPEPHRLVLVAVAHTRHGESMSPTITPGALVMVDRGPAAAGWSEVEDGAIYLVRPPDGDGVSLKRVFRAGHSAVMLWPDNPAMRPTSIEMQDRELRRLLIGRVRWVGQEV